MLITFLVILTLTVLYRPVRRWFRRWGTTDEDLRRVMAVINKRRTSSDSLNWPLAPRRTYRLSMSTTWPVLYVLPCLGAI